MWCSELPSNLSLYLKGSFNFVLTLTLTSLSFQFEAHFFSFHSFQCSFCQRSFVSDRLLSIHLSERHDTYFAVMSSRAPSYACLVDSCSCKFFTSAERRKHLVTLHSFPRSFTFENSHQLRVNKIKDSLKTEEKVSSRKKKENQLSTQGIDAITELSEEFRRKVAIPSKITFGRKKPKARMFG